MVPAARRGHPELAWGNVVGTVVILLGVNLGIVALVEPLVADPLVVRLHAPYLVGCLLLVGGRSSWRKTSAGGWARCWWRSTSCTWPSTSGTSGRRALLGAAGEADVWRRALLVWILLVGLAILNGAAREVVLSPRLGAAAGHVVSSILLAGLIALTAWLKIRWIAPGTVRRAWAVGVLWLSLTVAFEFLAGHYVFGHPWPRLLADYDILRGRVWLLILATALVAPAWAWRTRMP
jgi:hypothetical protein